MYLQGLQAQNAKFFQKNLQMSKKSSNFAVDFMLTRATYFEARRTEAALCHDFPADALFISGLHALQQHMGNMGNCFYIPVLKVMNTAHQLIAHMLMHPDRVDQPTYDVMALDLMNQDRQLSMLSMIVLIAMVTRTDGVRARKLRSAMLDERSDDFYEGLSFYEQFIEQSELYFHEEDFLIDVGAMTTTIRQQQEQIQQQQEELQQLKQQNNELMEAQVKHIGYNVENMTINMSGGTLIQHADNVYPSGEVRVENAANDAETIIETADEPAADTSFFGTDKYPADICAKNLREAIENAKSKADACRNIMTLDACGYIRIRQLTDAQKAEILNPFAAPKYVFTRQDFAKARNR